MKLHREGVRDQRVRAWTWRMLIPAVVAFYCIGGAFLIEHLSASQVTP